MGRYKFSVVIVVAPDKKPETLDSLEKVDYDKDRFEVIVEIGTNPSENRNNGVEKAKGEIIAFIDDDAVVREDILKKAERFFSEHKEIDIAGGPQLTPLDEKGFAKISGYALSSIFGSWKISNRYDGRNLILNADETMLTSANLFCRKKVFKKVKFNPALFPGEDPDFIAKSKKESFGIAYNPEIIVYHRRRNSVKKLVKQIYRYGKTRPEKETLRETLKMPFFLVPSIFLIYLFVLLILVLLNVVVIGRLTNLNLVLLAPLILYIILNISFSLGEAIMHRDIAAFFVLPLIYFIIHISYGTGFLLSSIKNIFKQRRIRT